MIAAYQAGTLKIEDDEITFKGRRPEERKAALEAYILSRYFGAGPKMIRLTSNQLEAMLNTKANFPIKYYEQPFPTIAIEFPLRLDGTRLHDIFGVIITKEGTNIAFHCYGTDFDISGRFRISPDEEAIMEEAFPDLCRAYPEKYHQSTEDLARIMLNCCQLMVMLGHTNKGKSHKGWDKISKAKNPPEKLKEKLRNEYETMPEVLTFEQHIVLHVSDDESVERQGGSKEGGYVLKPHFRSGHFKMQPYGEGSMGRKMIYIKPVFVNEHLFKGNMSDTKVSMEIK